jgi:hypothetical protein
MAALLGVVFTAELLAQTTAFTYQGRLQSDGTAYSGPAEFQFTLWDAAEEGTQLSATTPETLSGAVSGGLFTLVLDFGDGPFTGGEDRWLEIELRTGLGEFEVLTPRQKINTTPYALTAANVSGPVPAEQLDGALCVAASPGVIVRSAYVAISESDPAPSPTSTTAISVRAASTRFGGPTTITEFVRTSAVMFNAGFVTSSIR